MKWNCIVILTRLIAYVWCFYFNRCLFRLLYYLSMAFENENKTTERLMKIYHFTFIIIFSWFSMLHRLCWVSCAWIGLLWNSIFFHWTWKWRERLITFSSNVLFHALNHIGLSDIHARYTAILYRIKDNSSRAHLNSKNTISLFSYWFSISNSVKRII